LHNEAQDQQLDVFVTQNGKGDLGQAILNVASSNPAQAMLTDARVIGLSALTRVVLLAMFVWSDSTFLDHDAQGVTFFRGQCSWWLQPFTRWDAAHYLNVARDGTQSEMELAFLPGFPLMIRGLGLFYYSTGWLGRDDCLVLAAISISLLSFIGSSLIFARLLRQWQVTTRIEQTAFWLHLLSPANVFFVTAYTESLYSLLAWSAILLLEKQMFSVAWIPLVGASFVRSNATLNALFPLIAGARLVLGVSFKNRTMLCGGSVTAILRMLLLVLSVGATILPYFLMDRLNHRHLCTTSEYYRTENDKSCDSPSRSIITFNGVYAHIQEKYWGVGLFRYYQLKQIPNFALAFPILSLTCFILFSACRAKIDFVTVLGPAHFVHLGAHALLAVTWAHVQIATRLICASCPLFYMGLAHIFESSRSIGRFLVILFLAAYNIIGVMTHANFFPFL